MVLAPPHGQPEGRLTWAIARSVRPLPAQPTPGGLASCQCSVPEPNVQLARQQFARFVSRTGSSQGNRVAGGLLATAWPEREPEASGGPPARWEGTPGVGRLSTSITPPGGSVFRTD